MQIQSLAIPDVKLLSPKRFEDARGWFSEYYNLETFKEAGLDIQFVQDNQSLTREPGVIRGLHFQRQPNEQDKLLRVIRGRIFDVAVDIREESPTFGQHVSCELSSQIGTEIFIPKGFAHGFMALEPDTEVLYKVSDFYLPVAEAGINALDPALGIIWPLEQTGGKLSISLCERDVDLKPLCEMHNALTANDKGS